MTLVSQDEEEEVELEIGTEVDIRGEESRHKELAIGAGETEVSEAVEEAEAPMEWHALPPHHVCFLKIQTRTFLCKY